MALLSDGTAWCWGNDTDGACGTTFATYRAAPVLVEAAQCLTAIAPAEGSNAGGINAWNEVVIWGIERPGAESAGDGAAKGPGAGKSAILPIANPWQIRMTGGLGAVITEERLLYHWGGNPYWTQDVPALFPAPGPVIGVEVELNNACFLTEDGSVYCFGNNRFGAVGLPPSETFIYEPTRIDLPAPAMRVDHGFEAACAHLTTGDVYCWGVNSTGTLGFIEHPPSAEPLRIDGLPPVKELYVEQGGQCVIDIDDGVTCWGVLPYDPPAIPPRAWHPELRAARVAIGDNRICALTTDGRVYCEGDGAGVPGDVRGFVDIQGAIDAATP